MSISFPASQDGSLKDVGGSLALKFEALWIEEIRAFTLT
jgi:hypothetical protein